MSLEVYLRSNCEGSINKVRIGLLYTKRPNRQHYSYYHLLENPVGTWQQDSTALLHQMVKLLVRRVL